MRYEEFKKKSADKSSVWHYYLRAEDGQSAQCKTCKKVIKTPGGSTTGLRVHLKSSHSIDLNASKCNIQPQNTTASSSSVAASASSTSQSSQSCASSTPPIIKKRKLTDYFQSSDSMDAMICRMTALDGFPFSVFCTSPDLRKLFKAFGHDKLPMASKTIKNIVLNYCKECKKTLTNELGNMKKAGRKFSLSFDEWTSSRNRRYMNINIHCCADEFSNGSRFKNIGLTRIEGTMPAETCIQLLKVKLAEYNISLEEDIVAITTDGASVMCKVGRCIPALHQICLAHGIQLGVTDVLYKGQHSCHDDHTEFSEINVESITDSPNEDQNSSDDDDEYNERFEVVCAEPTNQNLFELKYKDLIEKVRKVVKIFKNSPTKNDNFLQKYVKQDTGKDLALILDCKTRWSSMATMLGRFNQLKSCVSKALIDMDSDIKFTPQEFQMLDAIHDSLNVIKATVEALCRRDATLLTAETSLKFMLRKLDQQDTHLSSLLAQSLRRRISQRRLPTAAILQYLHNQKTYFTEAESAGFDSGTFPKPSNDEIMNEIFALHNRLNGEAESPANTSTASDTSGDSTGERIISVEQELNAEIAKSLKEKNKSEDSEILEQDLRQVIRIEMALYENGGDRGRYLQEIYNYLQTIPPTSVESERAFSAATYISNKIRSSLNDESLDALCFLRAHFQEERSRLMS